MRCPSCSKFAAYDTGTEPEVELEVSSEENPSYTDVFIAGVTGSVRIVLTAECCSDELKESTFDIDETVEVTRAAECTCDLTDLAVEATETELTEERETVSRRTKTDGSVVEKPIAYRFQKQFYGARVEIKVSCSCGKSTGTLEFSDKCQASHMEELV